MKEDLDFKDWLQHFYPELGQAFENPSITIAETPPVVDPGQS